MAVLQEQSLREGPKPDNLSSGNLQAGHVRQDIASCPGHIMLLVDQTIGVGMLSCYRHVQRNMHTAVQLWITLCYTSPQQHFVVVCPHAYMAHKVTAKVMTASSWF